MEFALACLVALGILFIFTAIAIGSPKPSHVNTLVRQYAEPRMLEEMELTLPFRARILLPLVQALARILTRLTPKHFAEESRQKLAMAGNPYNWSPVELLGIRGLVAILSSAVFTVLFTILRTPWVSLILFTVIGAALGFYLPMLWLDLKVRARQDEIQRTLPDAIDLLTICVEVGLSLDAAITKVSEKWTNEISRAFNRVSMEIRLGKPRREALRDMANRTGVQDVTAFVAAVIQAEQLGTGVARVLRIQSEQMRVLRRQRAQERANQTPVKILFPLAFCIFPAMFVIILGPALIRLVFEGALKMK